MWAAAANAFAHQVGPPACPEAPPKSPGVAGRVVRPASNEQRVVGHLLGAVGLGGVSHRLDGTCGRGWAIGWLPGTGRYCTTGPCLHLASTAPASQAHPGPAHQSASRRHSRWVPWRRRVAPRLRHGSERECKMIPTCKHAAQSMAWHSSSCTQQLAPAAGSGASRVLTRRGVRDGWGGGGRLVVAVHLAHLEANHAPLLLRLAGANSHGGVRGQYDCSAMDSLICTSKAGMHSRLAMHAYAVQWGSDGTDTHQLLECPHAQVLHNAEGGLVRAVMGRGTRRHTLFCTSGTSTYQVCVAIVAAAPALVAATIRGCAKRHDRVMAGRKCYKGMLHIQHQRHRESRPSHQRACRR